MNAILIGYEEKKQVLIASGDTGEVNVKYNELRNVNGGEYNRLVIYLKPKKDQKFESSKDKEACEISVAGAENNLAQAKKALDSAKDSLKAISKSVVDAKNNAEKADKDKNASVSVKKNTAKLYDRAKNEVKSATASSEASVKACEAVLSERKETLKVYQGYLKEVTPKDKK